MERPTLAAITLHQSGGGVAAVASMLWRVFQEEWGSRARLVTLFDHENRPPTMVEKTRFALTMASLQASKQTDWILFGHVGLAQVQATLPARLKCPYGVFLYGFDAWSPITAREREALGAADVRIAISRFTAARANDVQTGLGPIDVCPLPLPTQRVVDDRTNVASVPALGPHAVLIVGRMSRGEQYKGHDQLIEAWPQVVARVPDAQLVVAGDGDDAIRLNAKAAASRAGSSIVFVGYASASTLQQLYERAALFALPSRGEGFGLVYLEAMSHRLACVASVHDAAGEVVVDGETGRLVDQGDIPALAETIAMLLLDDRERRRMGDAGYARLNRHFTFERFRSRVHELLGAAATAPAVAALP